jgi:hypothetical protein
MNPATSEQTPSVPAVAEVGPVQEKAGATGVVAWLMDEAIPIPGTRIKIGLDPLLGAFSALGVPVGDAVTNSVSIVALVEALRRGLPFQSMATIVGNILVNAGFGSVPIVGNIFSVFFRSNSRNRDIINDYLRKAVATGEPASWWRVVPLLIFLGLFVLGALLLNMMLWVVLLKFLAEHLGTGLPELKIP